MLLRRLINLKSLGLLHGPQALACLGVTEERIRAAISRDEETVVSERYLLHKQSYYENCADDMSVELCVTLEEVEEEVVEYLTQQELGREYGYIIDVYDLNLGKKLDYELVHTVKWKFDATS